MAGRGHGLEAGSRALAQAGASLRGPALGRVHHAGRPCPLPTAEHRHRDGRAHEAIPVGSRLRPGHLRG
eukprot:10414157-Alexandrium_andersonii.AAC.1